MGTKSWTRPVSEDATVQVSPEPDTPADGVVRYRIEFPFVVSDTSTGGVLITGDGEIEEHTLRSESGVPVSDLVVSIPDDYRVERLLLERADERIVIHLPSEALVTAVEETLDGDATAAGRLIEGFASPVQIPLVCGSFLGIRDTLRLTRELVRIDRHVCSLVHSYRYAIVRSALACRTGLYAASAAELDELVTGLDEIPEIGAVSTVDALADVMATVHGSAADTERLLESLGYELDSMDDGDGGLLTICYLAHTVCCDGIERAERHELRRELPSSGDYDRRKRAVLRTEYGRRSTAWRRLLDDARRQSPDEFRSVLAHTLFWTANESRSDSRMAELLYRGAERLASRVGDRRIEYGARYHRHLAAGHRLRGTHCYRPSIANFERAGRLARDYRFLEAWQPVLAKGLVQARLQSTRGNRALSIEILDDTIESLLRADPPEWAASRSVHHIIAQKRETEASLYRTEDPRRARQRLEDAEEHYEIIGFDRSRDRVQRKLVELETAIVSRDATDAIEPLPDEAPPAAERLPTAPDSVQRPIDVAEDGSDVEPESIEAPEQDTLDGMDYPEAAQEEEYSARFEDPYMS